MVKVWHPEELEPSGSGSVGTEPSQGGAVAAGRARWGCHWPVSLLCLSWDGRGWPSMGTSHCSLLLQPRDCCALLQHPHSSCLWCCRAAKQLPLVWPFSLCQRPGPGVQLRSPQGQLFHTCSAQGLCNPEYLVSKMFSFKLVIKLENLNNLHLLTAI